MQDIGTNRRVTWRRRWGKQSGTWMIFCGPCVWRSIRDIQSRSCENAFDGRTANNRSGPGVNWEEKDLDRGIYLPRHHCPFEGCEWSGKDSGDQLKHIMSEHWTEDMQEAVRLLGVVERGRSVLSAECGYFDGVSGESAIGVYSTGPEKLEALL